MPAGMNVSVGGCPAQGPTPNGTRGGGAGVPPAARGDSSGGAPAQQLLVRLRHIYAAGEGPLAVPVTVDLRAVLAPRWNVTGAVEMSLTATRPLVAARAAQTQWPETPAAAPAVGAATRSGPGAESQKARRADGLAVTLSPMEIRTFVLTLAD